MQLVVMGLVALGVNWLVMGFVGLVTDQQFRRFSVELAVGMTL